MLHFLREKRPKILKKREAFQATRYLAHKGERIGRMAVQDRGHSFPNRRYDLWPFLKKISQHRYISWVTIAQGNETTRKFICLFFSFVLFCI